MVAVLHLTLGGDFTYDTVWQVYIEHRVAVLQVSLCDIFTYSAVCQVWN